MMKLPKIFKFAIILFVFLFFLKKNIIAQEEFETSYFFTYTISDKAVTRVEQKISLKNTTEKIYADQYSLTIGSNQIFNVWAWDDAGSLEPQITTGENFTTINIKFKNKVVGKDKTNNITISYDTPDFAAIKGQILEINIPALAQKEKLTNYQAKLLVPRHFGPPSFIRPNPDKKTEYKIYQLYEFSQERLMKVEGISAAFGEAQIFDFKLLYFLKNSNNFTTLTEISLPSDTAYQQVFYDSLSPKPLKVKTDEDDNWLAIYKLKPKEELTITASGSAKLFIRPQQELKTSPLTEEEIKKYLLPQKYWEIENPEIKKLADELKTPEQIYKYVVKNLIYDYGRLNGEIKRLGALGALKNSNSALCSEFADLFIALCRAAGIPARGVAGFAYTVNPKLRPVALDNDILHAWAEYYDFKKQIWIPVDPTWEMTTGGVDYFNKLDLNHFSFVRQGIESDYPPPAGAFSPNPQQKTIYIEFGEKKDYRQNFEIKSGYKDFIPAGIPAKIKVSLINDGPRAIHNQIFKAQGPNYNFEKEIEVLPPFAVDDFELKINTDWKKSQNYTLTLDFNGKTNLVKIKAYFFPKYLYNKLIDLIKKI